MQFRRHISVFILWMICFSQAEVLGQSGEDDLNIFGFAQVILNARHYDLTILETNSNPLTIRKKMNANSFALHQVNLFFQKTISENTSFFLNIEATGSYSSKIPSGNLEIPEGWVSFRLGDQLELRTGLMLARFNNLNEIQNRLPLFPYLIRPIVYETFFANISENEDFKPNNAYIQLSGYKRISNTFQFDYAFYIGNAEDSFLSPIPAGSLGEEEESTALYQGENLNTQLLYGGRLGIENDFQTFKAGVSFTYDEDDRTKPVESSYLIPELTTPVLGEITRFRIGADLSFTNGKWVSESEFMTSIHDHSKVRKIQAFEQVNLNNYYFFSNLSYNFTDKFYVFGSQQVMNTLATEFVATNSPSKLYLTSLGSGWRANDVTVVKIQTIFGQPGPNDYVDFNIRLITIGISTIF